MIRFYAWKTPNGRKVAIMLAETGLAHEVRAIDIGADEQFAPAFLEISPNNKIPAIVDIDALDGPLALFESGAILTYLAERSGMLLPSGRERWEVLQWLHWSIGGIGPMLGQLGYFAVRAETKVPDAIGRFRDECVRLLRVLERRLAVARFVGGSNYSIADIATYPWIAAARETMDEPLGEAFAASPRILAWMDEVGGRTAVRKGMTILEDR